MSEKFWDANRIAKLVALETTVENIRARWPLETGPALAALVSVLDIFDPEVKMDAKNLGDLQAELDHLAETRKDRHEHAWEIDGIKQICAKLVHSQEFDANEKDIILGALRDREGEVQALKEERDQAVHAGIIAIANRIYYAQNETERGEILQVYAEWYHAQVVQDQNLEQINRISRVSREEIQEREARQGYPDQDAPPEHDEVPF